MTTADQRWVPYADRDEWKDVSPIYHDDLEKAVVNIAYSQQFAEVFAYFRAVLASNESSERALQLTTDAVKLNPANYTVWHFRRKLIQDLKIDLGVELEFCADIIIDNPKNYQVWYHRSVLVEWLNKGEQELGFTSLILGMDAKNYHAWQHRQWAVSHFQLFENEMAYCNLLLAEDLRNNSAWNYRYFIIKSTTGFADLVIKEELQILFQYIRSAPHNESAWNYLTGMLLDKIVEFPVAVEFCEELYSQTSAEHRPSSLLVFMLDYLEERLEKRLSANSSDDLKRMEELCNELVRIDPIRKEYWNFLKRGYVAQFSPAGSDSVN